jgi:superkiller protein 3
MCQAARLGSLFAAETDYQSAIASCDQALAINPDYHGAWTNRGVALVNLGRVEEAISSYDQALAINSDFHQAWYNKACAYGLQGNLALALENLRQAIALCPDEYRAMARTDSDFDPIRADPGFQPLI